MRPAGKEKGNVRGSSPEEKKEFQSAFRNEGFGMILRKIQDKTDEIGDCTY